MLSFVRTLLLQIGTVIILPMILGLNGIWLSGLISEVIMIGVTILTIKKMNKRYNYY